MITIDDIEDTMQYEYWEYTKIRSNNIQMIQDRKALWQALVGEIKTHIGEVNGVGLENYGTDLWRLVGQNIDSQIVATIDYYINPLIARYDEITNLKTITANSREGGLDITIEVTSTLGTFR